MSNLHIEIVSAESAIYSGECEMVVAPAAYGDIGIKPKHAPLITILQTGQVRLLSNDEEQIFYVEGGILEVLQEIQPVARTVVTVLADIVARAADLDEERAILAKQQAEENMKQAGSKVSHAHAAAELAKAVAQLRAIQKIRKKKA